MNVNVWERALEMKRLRDMGVSQDEISKKLQLSSGAVSVSLGVFGLPKTIQGMIADNRLDIHMVRSLRAFRGHPDEDLIALAQHAVAKHWDAVRINEEGSAYLADRKAPEAPPPGNSLMPCPASTPCGGSGRVGSRPCVHCSVLNRWTLFKGTPTPVTVHNVGVVPDLVYEVTCPRCFRDRVEHFFGVNITTNLCGHCAGTLEIKALTNQMGGLIRELPPLPSRDPPVEPAATEGAARTPRTPMTMQDEDTHLRGLYKEVEDALTEEYTKATGTKARSIGHVMELLAKARDHSYAIASTRHTAVASTASELEREKAHTRRLEDRIVEVEREIAKTKEDADWKKMADLKKILIAKDEEGARLRRDLDAYRRKAEEKTVELDPLKAKIERLSVNLEENRRALNLRENEKAEVLDELREARARLGLYAKDRDDYAAQAQRAQDERTRAQQELALKSIDLTNLKERYEREKKEVEMTFDDLMNEMKETRRENAEILAALKTLSTPKIDTKETPMPENKNDKSVMQKIAESKAVATLKVDATEAGWRVAGSQFTKLAKEPLVALLARNLGPDDEALRGRIAAFLNTELGEAMLTALLSAGLSAIPGEPTALPAMMARELRVRSMAGAGDVIADVLMGPLRQVAVMYLQSPTEAATPAALPGGAGFGDNVLDMNAGSRAKVG